MSYQDIKQAIYLHRGYIGSVGWAMLRVVNGAR